ncbi:tyrosine-protein kinase Etk/Wzc [Erwinia toletana]|uniref:Tyrosine-protein kinase Etk/Wzc n=1 Tax=Winslowiella toletana TaxID=92490 RepID=A0ABS4P4E1_9GAMM|nr:polysaccharide biosynthesis tyrosine autokinase [Winslowiella toletana]MBP2167490.1 tyrosine-protein kinase Etk/Wzc [Winslowiella toletana]
MTEKNKLSLPGISDNRDEIDLGRVWGSLVDAKWLILTITLFFIIISIIYVLFTTPVYRADAVVQVEKAPGSSLISTISSMMPDSEPASSTEIALIQSRMVLGQTIDDLHLEYDVARNYFPVFGKGYAALTGDDKDVVTITTFTMPQSSINQPFTLTVTGADTYTLSNDQGEILSGKVGERVTGKGYSLLISALESKEGREFTVVKHPLLSVYNTIYGVLQVADAGKDTGVINLSYDDTNPQKAADVLNSVIDNYQLQNVNRKTAEAQKSLQFLADQLPKVRGKLDSDEDKLNAYRRANDSVDMSLEAKSTLDTLVQLEGQLNELTFKETDISKLYTKQHPAYKALVEKRRVLEDERNELNKKVSALPETQQQILRLTREVEVGQQVYMQMLNRQQELKIAEASTVGNVRIIDPAMTRLSAVKPMKAVIVLLAAIFGGFLACAWVLARKAMHKGIESPDQLESMGINVYASIPLSKWQQDQNRTLATAGGKLQRQENLLALGNPTDLALEAIRSLRTSLHFAMMESQNNILMISGVSPSIGKSFISANLAAILAQAGQRVLLIDADMRKGYMHTLLEAADGDKGLSQILSGRLAVEDAVKPVSKVENLSVISRGQIPPNPSELLMNKRFDELLDWANKNFDIVLIDTPPILAVTDAAICGRSCGTSLLVARFEETTAKEVDVSIRRFEQNGVEIKGVILNLAVQRAASQYGNGGYSYYQYEYGDAKK